MNIAIFASAFHPSLGGVEELTRQLAHALERAGHRAIILTERWPRDLPEREEFEGLSVHRFAFRVPVESRSAVRRLRTQITASVSRPRVEGQIARLLREEKIDIVHVQCVSSNALYARAAAHKLGLPFVVTLQGELTMDAAQIFQKFEGARAMMRGALEAADAITGCSGQTVAEAQEFWGQPFGQRARVVYNGIRLKDFENVKPHHHPKPYILGIGRHVPQKGFDVLLRAYAMGRKSALEAGNSWPDLLLAGDGAQHEALQTLSEQLGLGEAVQFVGRVDRAGAMALFKGCSFFTLPSRHEPMGIVNLEAMAAGRAVIASRVGGVPELVGDGQNGLLVPPDDAPALAVALARLVNDAALNARLGANGARRVRDFDWDAIAAQYLDVYQFAQTRAARSQT